MPAWASGRRHLRTREPAETRPTYPTIVIKCNVTGPLSPIKCQWGTNHACAHGTERRSNYNQWVWHHPPPNITRVYQQPDWFPGPPPPLTYLIINPIHLRAFSTVYPSTYPSTSPSRSNHKIWESKFIELSFSINPSQNSLKTCSTDKFKSVTSYSCPLRNECQAF